jgi:hypothetical protein
MAMGGEDGGVYEGEEYGEDDGEDGEKEDDNGVCAMLGA